MRRSRRIATSPSRDQTRDQETGSGYPYNKMADKHSRMSRRNRVSHDSDMKATNQNAIDWESVSGDEFETENYDSFASRRTFSRAEDRNRMFDSVETTLARETMKLYRHQLLRSVYASTSLLL